MIKGCKALRRRYSPQSQGMRGCRALAVAMTLLLALAARPLLANSSERLLRWFSAEQQQAFGFHRLNEAQRQALAAWLAERVPLEAAVPFVANPTATGAEPPKLEGAVSDFGREQVPVVKQPLGREPGGRIRAHIKGTFYGWEGKTLFHLDNGQLWRQRSGGRYRYRAESPAVEIVKGRFGYYLEVIATGRQTGVRRLR